MPCFPQARVPLQSDKFTTHSTVPPPWLPGCCVCLQNQGNSEKVAQLWADNQKLNRSLQSARVRYLACGAAGVVQQAQQQAQCQQCATGP